MEIPTPSGEPGDVSGPAFDLEAAMARLGNDAELFWEMVGFFVSDSCGLVEQVRQGVRLGDAKLVERAAHSLKGMASMFDARRTVASAAAIEELGRMARLDLAAKLVDDLEAEVRQVTASMGQLRAWPR